VHKLENPRTKNTGIFAFIKNEILFKNSIYLLSISIYKYSNKKILNSKRLDPIKINPKGFSASLFLYLLYNIPKRDVITRDARKNKLVVHQNNAIFNASVSPNAKSVEFELI
jgi:hypothetical protein